MAIGNRKKAAAFFAIVILMIFMAWTYFRYNGLKDAGYVSSTGIVEATEAGFGPRSAGKVDWLCCAEGESVKAGQALIKMESSDLSARLEESLAAVAGAEASVNDARVGLEAAVLQHSAARAELEAASSEVERIKALSDDAGRNIERTRGLFTGGYVSVREMDSAQATHDSIVAQLGSARARKRVADSNYAMSSVGIKSAGAKVRLSLARLEQAKAQVKVLDALLADQTIASTMDGVVAYRAFEPGENVAQGQAVYTIYGTIGRWVRVDIEESLVGLVRLGAPVEVRLPSGAGRTFSARVTEIGVVGGFATQRDVTRGRADIRTFRVKAAVDDPQGILKPGMTVEVRIRSSAVTDKLKAPGEN